ncbi:MAG: hypothetical protein RR661_06935, partial [Anaerovoracaceae bacterium]
ERPTDNRIYNQLTADYMEVFNALVKDVPGIYYQSYAFDMKNSKSDPAMGIFHRIIGKLEGPNDGLVSVESAKWGDFRGVFPGSGEIGISHPNAVDGRRRPFRKKKDGFSDITDFYVALVARLKNMGY